MKKSFLKKSLSALVIFLMLAGSANAQSINWTPPGGQAPGSNVPAPVNVGDAFQKKTGGLWVDDNFTVGKPGAGIFISDQNSYLRGMSVFSDRNLDENGDIVPEPNLVVSFLQSFFFDDVHVGDASYPTNLSVDGGFKFLPQDDNGNPIPYQPGNVLTVDDAGNASWSDSSGLPSCEVGQIPEYQQIDDDNYAWGCASAPLPPVCADGQVLTYDTGMSQWSCTTLDAGTTTQQCSIEGSFLRWNNGTSEWECTTHALAFNGVQPRFDILDDATLNILPGALLSVSDGASQNIRPTGLLNIMSSPLNSNFKVGGAPGINKILADRGDGQGFVGWKTAAELGIGGGGGTLPAGTINQTLRHDGTTWIANSLLENNGSTLKYNMTTTPADLKEGALLASTNDQGNMAWQPGLTLVGPAFGNGTNFWFDDFPSDNLTSGSEDFSSMTRFDSDFPITTNGIFVKNSANDDPLQGALISAEGRTYLKGLEAAPTENGLARVCVDADGLNDVPGDEDDYRVFKCRGDAGFLYTYLGTNNYDNDDPANPDIDNYAYYYEDEEGNPQYMQDVQTNGNGRSFIREWTVPDEIYSVTMQIASGAGGGGGGGAGQQSASFGVGSGGAGGGGGGSGYMTPFFNVPVTPGETLCIFTGRGGKGGYGVAKKRNRDIVETIVDLNLDLATNFVKAKPGQNGGNSFVARPPVGGDCYDVNPNNPILPQGAGIVIGGLGGGGGNSNPRWTDLGIQLYDPITGQAVGDPIPPNQQVDSFEVYGPVGGNGGLAGYHGQNYGYSGSSGDDGFPNLSSLNSSPGAGGTGGAGGASGSLTVQIGGGGGDNYYVTNVDANKDGNYVTGRNGPQNTEGEKARGLGDHGKSGTTLFVNQNFPGGGSGGGGAARGYYQGNPVQVITGVTPEGDPPFGYFWVGVYYDGSYYGGDGIGLIPQSVTDANPPGDNEAWCVSVHPLYGLYTWTACDVDISYDTHPAGVASKYTMLDFDGDGVTDNNVGIGQPREQWGAEAYLVQGYNLGTSVSSISTHASASGYTQNEINAYLDNLCMKPFDAGDPLPGSQNSPSTLYKISNLSGCGGDGGTGGSGNIMILY